MPWEPRLGIIYDDKYAEEEQKRESDPEVRVDLVGLRPHRMLFRRVPLESFHFSLNFRLGPESLD